MIELGGLAVLQRGDGATGPAVRWRFGGRFFKQQFLAVRADGGRQPLLHIRAHDDLAAGFVVLPGGPGDAQGVGGILLRHARPVAKAAQGLAQGNGLLAR